MTNADEMAQRVLDPIKKLAQNLTEEQRNTSLGNLVMWFVGNSATIAAQLRAFSQAVTRLDTLDALERMINNSLNSSRDTVIGALEFQQKHCSFISETLQKAFCGRPLDEMIKAAEEMSETTIAEISGNVKKLIKESKVQIGQSFLFYSSVTMAASSVVSITQVVSMFQELSTATNVVKSSREKLRGIIKSKIDEANEHLNAANKFFTESSDNHKTNLTPACLRISRANLCCAQAGEELFKLEIQIGNSVKQLGKQRVAAVGTAVSSSVQSALQVMSIFAVVPNGGIAMWLKVFAWSVAATQAGLGIAGITAYVITGVRLQELQKLNEEVLEQRKILDNLQKVINETSAKIESSCL